MQQTIYPEVQHVQPHGDSPLSQPVCVRVRVLFTAVSQQKQEEETLELLSQGQKGFCQEMIFN